MNTIHILAHTQTWECRYSKQTSMSEDKSRLPIKVIYLMEAMKELPVTAESIKVSKFR